MLPIVAFIAVAQAQSTFTSTAWRADADELRYYWVPEIALTGAVVATWFKLHDFQPRRVEGFADPSGIDAAPRPRWNKRAQKWSDTLGLPHTNFGLNLPAVSIIGVGVWGGVKDQSVGSGAVHSLVVLEAYGATIIVTETLKRAISRPRPYTAKSFVAAHPDVVEGEDFQAEFTEEGDWDAYKSMPSGHTSGTGAFSFAIATLVWRDAATHGTDSPGLAAAAFGTAGALTVTVGALRVAGGKHHVSDTVVGGLIGAGIGTGVAWLHTGIGNASRSDDAPAMLTIGGAW